VQYFANRVCAHFPRRCGGRGVILVVRATNNREGSNKHKHESNDDQSDADGNISTQQSRVFLVCSNESEQAKEEGDQSTIEQSEYTQ